MKKDSIKTLCIILIATLVSSLVSVAASGHLFDSNEVVYDNTNSGMSSSNVKDAVDELYAQATNYSSIDGRLQTLENYFPEFVTSQNKTRYPFSGQGINLGINGDQNELPWIDFYYNGAIKSSIYYTNTSYGDLYINGRSSSLNLIGQPVRINNMDVILGNKNNWGTSISFNIGLGASHVILCVSDSMYMIWVAGNPLQVNLYKIYGPDVAGIKASLSGSTVTVKTSASNTISAFVSGPVY